MRTSDVDIIIVPGFGGGSEEHWYSRWAAKLPTARRVEQADWHHPALANWVGRLVEAVDATTRPAVLIAHSLGVLTVAQAADRIAERVAGAFLVAPPSLEWIRESAVIDTAFAELPGHTLPFPAVLIASRTDQYASWGQSEEVAAALGVDLIDAGDSGHLNDDSGHGPWPEGLMRFAGFLKTL